MNTNIIEFNSGKNSNIDNYNKRIKYKYAINWDKN